MRWRYVAASAAAVVGVLAQATPAAAQGVVVQYGEIVVMEGDGEIVGGASGSYQIGPANQVAILDRFYQHYPDEFDEVVVWTSFRDAANPGAYFTSGVPSPANRLIGFVNMNQVGMWGQSVIPVIGQEFSHAWLAFASFVDPATSLESDELLGRDFAHWSALMDADGSVQDGIDWEDNGDGTFTCVGVMNKWSELDLWYMGFVEASEVSDFALLRNATVVGSGTPITPTSQVSVGTTVNAQHIMVSIDDVIAADGNQPPTSTRQHDFRLAFVLVTEPGQSAAAAQGTADQLDLIRREWNDKAEEWLWYRGTMCTDTTAPCDIPHARFVTGRFTEGMDADGDGVVEPGERSDVEVDWRNTGIGTTTGATASLTTEDMRFEQPASVALDDIPEGAVGTSVFDLAIPGELACGDAVTFDVVSTIGMREFHGQLVFIAGVVEGAIETFATPASYVANPNSDDTASSGGWAYGIAELVEYEGRTTQPSGGADGPDDPAWWTGTEMGFDWKANDLDAGLTTLVSPAFDLTGLYEPSLRYRVWYAALSFNGPSPVATQGDDLVVEASVDDGATWVEIDRVSGEPRAWELREAPLGELVDYRDGPVRFRFTAQDGGDEQNLVEVGIDDVQLVSLSADCEGSSGGGCGCRAGDGQGGLGGLLLLGLLAIRRRRR